jgi:hypothetical protein
MGWWSAMSDRVGEVRYEKTISFGNWISIIATLGSALATVALGIWFASAFVASIHDQIASGSALTDLRITQLTQTIADMKNNEASRTADLLDRLKTEAELRAQLDRRLDAVLQQRRGDAGTPPGTFR